MIDLRVPRGANIHAFINELPWAPYGVSGPADFKPAKRSTVHGGRWKIRRKWGTNRPWRVYTTGIAKRYSRNMPTWELAYEWACAMIEVYRVRATPEERDQLVHRVWEYDFKERVVFECKQSRYTRRSL